MKLGEIIRLLLGMRMNFRVFIVWVFFTAVCVLIVGILYQLYRATENFADGVPALMNATSIRVS